jgi:hypothetical protein
MAEIVANLEALAARWANAKAAERANAQSYLIELCEALGVPRPQPAGSGYEFEFAMTITARDGSETPGFVDCYRQGHFVLEAKDYVAGAASDLALRKAYGQARMYANHDPSGAAPPYVLVLDVAKTLLIFHRWGGSYQGFAAGYRIDLATLHEREEDIALLRDIWTAPAKRDPRITAQAVTTEIAGHLAELAAALEGRGFPPERVSRFLMRIVFSCFAEDVGLLPREAFRQTVQNAGVDGSPERLAMALESLWTAMDAGGMFGYEKLLRFNGHFFRDAEALPLTTAEVALVLSAAKADWKDVEPSIFGTLLVRALDPEERHRLGAEYTPRSYIERLVRPTVEVPVRERWTAVQVDVVQLRESGKPKDRALAEERLRAFLAWMRGLRILDPACGSGNFLYVTMHLLKDIEFEVVEELARLTGRHELRMEEIGPANFLGIEVKEWAREIAELVLWIGFHQHWRRHHDVQPPEPVLQDTGSLECKDAVLSWTSVHEDVTRSEPDPTPRLTHPVTGRPVPDPASRRPYHQYRGPQPAQWPAADFVIGNPPYIGGTEMRETLGAGYVDALRATYRAVPDGADYVMYWWTKAVDAVASGRTIRAGLITTNSITQVRNRALVESAAERGVRVTWAVADHPWVEDADGAAVRVAMTVLAKDPVGATLVRVDENARAVGEVRVRRLNADLSAHADVPTAAKVPLAANTGVSFAGFQLFGDGFLLDADEAARFIAVDERHRAIVKPYLGGKDLTGRPRGLWVIDFGLRSEEEARAFPVLYDLVRDRVRPERDANRSAYLARRWWQFGRTRGELRQALAGLPRYIATVETAKHRFFAFLDASVAPDNMLTVMATADAFHLGVLSSRVHIIWALAAGGTLEDRPRYQKTLCFDPFPFPEPSNDVRTMIATTAEQLDAHRWSALRRDSSITMTGMYNVVVKLRSGASLTAAERTIHEGAACGVLRDLHDRLDQQVAAAYGWSWPEDDAVILERLVALHDQRVVAEHYGETAWLRPDVQRQVAVKAPVPSVDHRLVLGAVQEEDLVAAWPRDAIGQITALRTLAASSPVTADDAARHFKGARRDIVARHFDTLTLLGEVILDASGRYSLADGALATA